MLWTMLGAKQTSLLDHEWPKDRTPLIRSYSASYLFDGSRIQLADANARTLHARGGVSNLAAWELIRTFTPES